MEQRPVRFRRPAKYKTTVADRHGGSLRFRILSQKREKERSVLIVSHDWTKADFGTPNTARIIFLFLVKPRVTGISRTNAKITRTYDAVRRQSMATTDEHSHPSLSRKQCDTAFETSQTWTRVSNVPISTELKTVLTTLSR